MYIVCASVWCQVEKEVRSSSALMASFKVLTASVERVEFKLIKNKLESESLL